MPVHRLAERVIGRQPALVHRGRGQRGEADHVADGVDVVDLGLVVLVDEDPAAVVGLQAGGGQVEVVGLALPAGGVHHRVGGDLLAAGQRGDGARAPTSTAVTSSPNRKVTARSRRWNRSASTISGSQNSSIVVPLLDDGDLGAQRGEHRRVLDADDAGADDDHRRRDATSAPGCRRSPARGPRRTRRPTGRAGLVPVAMTM